MTSIETPPPSTRCFDASAVITRIVHLPVMVTTDHLDDDLWEYLTDGSATEVLEERFGAMGYTLEAVMNEFGDRRDAQQEALSMALVHTSRGWLVEITTPVRRRREGEEGISFSWGYTRAKSFYADTYDEAIEAALSWAENYDEESFA